MKRFLLAMLLVATNVSFVLGATAEPKINPDGTVNAAAFASLSTCKASALSAGRIVVVKTVMPCNNLNWPTDRKLRIVAGGRIDPASGKTFNGNGIKVDAGYYQVFGGAGSVIGLKYATPDMFGADATAVQKAISALITGGVLYLDASRSYTSGAISLQPGISIIGNAASATNGTSTLPGLTYNGTTGDFITLTGGTGESVTGVTIQGIRISGNGTSGNVLNLGSTRSRIEANDIYNGHTLINFPTSSNWAGENIVALNFLHNCDTAILGNGANVVDNEIINNIIYVDGGDGTYGIKMDSGANNISNNHIYGGFKYYVYLTGNGIRIHNNHIDNVGSRIANGAGIYINSNSSLSNSSVKGNTITFPATAVADGIYINSTATGRIDISNNIINALSGATVTGIRSSGTAAFYGTVAHNLFQNVTKYSLHSGSTATMIEQDAGHIYNSSNVLHMNVNPNTLGATQEFSLRREFSGGPESAITANTGSLYSIYSLNSGQAPFYLKTSGTGNTGWRALMYSLSETPKGTDATGTRVYSSTAATLGPNTGFMRVPKSDGSGYVYVPYWDAI